MHQVKERRMPLFRTATGCRWRKTLLMTAITRVRRSRGTPWRKTEFQTWELRTHSIGARSRFIEGFDFGFWIADFGLRIQIQNPQSKIQNNESPITASRS